MREALVNFDHRTVLSGSLVLCFDVSPNLKVILQ